MRPLSSTFLREIEAKAPASETEFDGHRTEAGSLPILATANDA